MNSSQLNNTPPKTAERSRAGESRGRHVAARVWMRLFQQVAKGTETPDFGIRKSGLGR
jgi:hypothetical protein